MLCDVRPTHSVWYSHAKCKKTYGRVLISDFDQTREDIGLDARAGLNVRLTRSLGIFAEYRLTYVDQTFEFSRQGLRSVVETDPSTHHVLGGISLRF